MQQVINLATCQPTEDPNVRVYNAAFTLVDVTEHAVRGIGSVVPDQELSEFTKLILAVDGVQQADIAPYAMMITKAALFDWAPIHDGISAILAGVAASRVMMANIDEEVAGMASQMKRDRG
jgi:hypothetical protein